MPKIRISYRRSDFEAITGRILARLIVHYGNDAISFDLNDISLGTDFERYIGETLLNTNILLAIMGPQWLGTTVDGLSGVPEESDPVRIEIETALRRRVPIIPVLIGSTKMPTAEQLPPSLQDLAFRNAVKVDVGEDFDYHMDRLIRSIDEILGPPELSVQARRPTSTLGTIVPVPPIPTTSTTALPLAALMRRRQELRPRINGGEFEITAFAEPPSSYSAPSSRSYRIPGPRSSRLSPSPAMRDDANRVDTAHRWLRANERSSPSVSESRIALDEAYPSAPAPRAKAPNARRSWRGLALLFGAAAFATAGYFWRHEIAQATGTILKLLGLASATVPPAPAREGGGGIRDLVDVSAFAPERGRAGEDVLVQIFLHALEQEPVAINLAREADPDAPRRGLTTLAVKVERDQRVDVLLEAAGLSVDEPYQSLVWQGQPRSCQFVLTLPKGQAERTSVIKARILIDSVPVGSLRFTINVTAADVTSPLDLSGEAARRYQHAFLSHSHEDRVKVLTYAQLLEAAGINYFQDIASLRAMEDWETKLHDAIDHCDLFLLFWTGSAARSEWVERETKYALARQKASSSEEPDIMPIFLEPDAPRPPDWLKSRHFDSILRLAMRGADAERRTN